MDLYNLGAVSWWESQCLYHALALLGREGLIICYPTSPYVCLGLHDDLEQEIDQGYCREQGIPLLRRETGGGVVYLDDRQVFFQLVLRKDNPLLPLKRHRFYQKFLQPAMAVYRSFGVPVELKPPADLVVHGRKCSGNACGDVGPCVAYVGNLLLDFNFVAMSNVLQVPTEAYRQYLYRSIRNNMTTLADWVEYPVAYGAVVTGLVEGFTQQLGSLSSRGIDKELMDTAQALRGRLTSTEWLSLPGRRQSERRVKIAEGIYLLEHKLGKNGTALILIRDGIIEEVAMGETSGVDRRLQSLIGCLWRDDLLVSEPV